MGFDALSYLRRSSSTWVSAAAPRFAPDADCGYRAASEAGTAPVVEGSVGAGAGATIGKIAGYQRAMKGGIGSSAIRMSDGLVVAAPNLTNSSRRTLVTATRSRRSQGEVLGARCPDTVNDERDDVVADVNRDDLVSLAAKLANASRLNGAGRRTLSHATSVVAVETHSYAYVHMKEHWSNGCNGFLLPFRTTTARHPYWSACGERAS